MSNQEAIALLRNLEDSLDSYCELSEEGKTAFRMAIEALSSSEFPNSSDTDTISREQAIEALEKWLHSLFGITEADGTATIFKTIRQLPPIKPKRGKWIDTRGNEEWYAREYRCSECGDTMLGEANFCPNCGAKMEGEQNG